MRGKLFILLIAASLGINQCSVSRKILGEEEKEKNGLEGYAELCKNKEQVNSLLISKADAIIDFQGDRYETKITLYHIFDSVMFITAVNSGYEVFRGRINKDTITVIDRMNKIVYYSALKKRFGYQHPVDYENLEQLTSNFGYCDVIENGIDLGEGYILIDLSQGYTNKKIYLNREHFYVEKFEFSHTKTGDYIAGEKMEGGGFSIESDFLINQFKLKASGGEYSYDREIDINMNVNPKKYSFVELQ